MTLDDRKAKVLRAVVEEYIETGLPVGSRAIARRYHLGVSPATIRNEMADLEETGYLDKLHTSSGRVPSDRGYRFYVDKLMPKWHLTVTELEAVESNFRSRVRDFVSTLRDTVRSISETSNYLGFILGPEAESVSYKAIHLLPSGLGRARLVVVTDIGLVESCVVELPPMSRDEIERLSDMLSRNLTGIPLEKVADRAYDLLHEEAHRYAQILDQVVEFLRSAIDVDDSERLYVGGTVNLLSQPEFRDVDKVKGLLSAIESPGVIQASLTEDSQFEDPAIRIGEENRVPAVKDVSLVFGAFVVGNTEGKIGILGPKRMNYSKVVAIVREFEKRLSDYFSQEE